MIAALNHLPDSHPASAFSEIAIKRLRVVLGPRERMALSFEYEVGNGGK